jgi:serine/threonine protein kinase
MSPRGEKGICETPMLRKKVLSVSPTKATLLVEESATGHLKVLRRVNTSSWSAAEVEEAQRLYGVLAQTPIPVLVETDNVVFQSAYLNVVTPHFAKGELASHVRASPQQPPTDAQIARWIHVIALGIQSVHRLGFVHGALKLTKVYLTDDRGAAGIVLGSPLPLPLYREALDNARAHAGGGGMGSADGQHHSQRHFYNDDENRGGGALHHGASGGVSSSTSLHSNISINSLELNYPPEVLHSAANRELHYTAQSDVWHLGAMLMALAAAHGQLQHRSSELHSLVNDMCDDVPDRRVTLPEIIRRLVAVQSAGAPRLVSTAAPTTTTTIEAPPPHQHNIAANTTSRTTGSLPLPGELQPSSIDRSEAYTTVDEDEVDDSSVEPVWRAAERSPDPLDPRLATQRYVPPPPLVLKKQSTMQTTQQVQQRQLNFAALDATQQQHSNAGIVLTPRGGGTADLQQRAPPKELIGGAAGGPRRTPSAAARAVPLTSNGAASQRSGRLNTPVRAHSKPAGGGGITPRGGGAAAGGAGATTAVRQAQNANSAYLIHAFERQEAELQRRRDEQTRDAAKRREELASMKEAADAAHRQHVDNLRRIHKKHDNEHRGDIRKSIKLWQQRQGHTAAGVAAPSSDDARAVDDDQHHDPQQQQHRHTIHPTGSGGGIVLDDGHGVVVFATAEAPPSRSTARRQTQQQTAAGHKSGATAEHDRRIADSVDDDRVDDPNVVNYVVSPRRTVKQLPQEPPQQRLQHRTESIEEESSTVLIRRSVVATSTVVSHTNATPRTPDNMDGDDDDDDVDERNMTTTTTASSSYDTASNVVGSPRTPLSATVSRPGRVDPPTAFEITPPRKRRVGAAAEVSAPPAAGGVAPFQHHLRHATTSDTLQSTPQGLASTTQQQRHNEVLAGGAAAAQQSLSDPPRSLSCAGVSATNHRDPTPVTSGRPKQQQHSRSILDEDHVSASAALEWTVESLRRSLTHGPWRSLRCSGKREDLLEAPSGNVLLVSRLLHLVDEFICLPAKVRVQLKENAQLFERVRRLVLESRRPSTTAALDDGNDEAEDQQRKEGLFAVVAPLVCQLVAVEGALALSRELRGTSSNDDEGQ